MRRICVANQKGGVAKTTTSLNLAAELARAGKKVILIDMDPQYSSTAAIFGNQRFEFNIYNVIVDKMDIRSVVQHSDAFGIDVVPSDIELSGATLRINEHIGREKVLYHYTQKLNYDYMIVDAPPSLGLLTVNALTACHELVVPICPEFFSLKGIKLLEEIVENVRSGLGANIEITGVVITRYRERVVTNEARDAIRNYFGKKVFNVMIPENIKIEEAHNAHLPIYKYDKTSKGAEAYRQLAKEIMNGKPKKTSRK
ncbi:MAG: ParA family protein [Candidatus Omnitrophica bacterium]|nr:ParA family protein [Candidatus Omnitrophota bacterium]